MPQLISKPNPIDFTAFAMSGLPAMAVRNSAEVRLEIATEVNVKNAPSFFRDSSKGSEPCSLAIDFTSG